MFCHSARLRDRSPRLKLVLSDSATCGVFYLTDINMWYPMAHINNHQDFLKFEAVLAHCEKRAPEGSLFSAMEYGREMQFFDGHNSLSVSGHILADMLMPSAVDW